MAYLGSSRLENVRLSFIHALSIVRSEQTEASLDLRILSALFCESQNEAPLVGNASELAKICRRRDVQCTETEVSRALRQFGFDTKSVRTNEEIRKRYVVSKQSLGEIVTRFLGGSNDATGPAMAVTTGQPPRNEELRESVVSVVGSGGNERRPELVGSVTADTQC